MASAAPKIPEPDPPEEAKPAPAKAASPIVMIAAVLVLTGFGVGAGGLFGLQIVTKVSGHPSATKSGVDAQAASGTARYPSTVNVRSLPAIITNLAAPERTWIRLEVALIMENEQSAEASVVAAAITEDIVAFLRSVSMKQIEGASGFQHLREDLTDRARVRSNGKVRELIIQTMVVE